jgi:carboxyl-terminal processing protease
MKKNNYFHVFFINVILVALVFSCQPDNSDDPTDSSDDSLSALNLHINEFIWTGLHVYYLWVDEVPNLSDSKFPSKASWAEFLRGYDDHEELFYDLLYKYNVVDRFSWIVDDYVALEQMFQGISKSMGYEFKFGSFAESNTLFGVVIYVLKGSPAEAAGMKRGDIFVFVNGQSITKSNYKDLLYSNETYTLSFGQISGDSVVPNNKSATLTAVEIHENPILLDTVYYINSKKIGYLVYNSFIPEYDVQLNNVFNKFKSQNINDLILDLRYNSGGAVNSAAYLASMIYSTDTNKVFIAEKYNDQLQEYIDNNLGTDYSKVTFADKIKKTERISEIPIVSLGLNRLFMITTKNTASASELVLSGLRPYIPVVTVGTTTYGKYVGSITLKDYDSKGNINPFHKWAMQPIIMKAINAAGESDYNYGFAPTDSIREVVSTMLAFGDINEPLLSTALAHISGSFKSSVKSSATDIDFVPFGFSKEQNPFSKEMYIENIFQQKREK